MSEQHYTYADLVTRLEWEPSIPLEIKLRSGTVLTDSFHAKLDSGASHCYFDREFAEALGIDLSGPETTKVVTGSGRVLGWLRELEIVVPAWKQDQEPICLPVAVYFVNGRKGLALLGLVGFFNRLTLRIDDANQQLWWRRP